MTSARNKQGIFLLVISLIACNVYSATTGKIAGRITDKQSGEGLPGVNITVVGTTTGAATDIDGFYSIISLPPQTYTLKIAMIGYTILEVKGVKVNVGRTTTQNAELFPEAIKGETVTILAERPLVEMDRTSTAYFVDSETIKNLPVTSVAEVIALQAGVTKDAGGGLHFRGGRTREAAYYIDGVPVSNAFSQGGGINTSVETSMVQELEIISGTFNAEYGEVQSAVINIITKDVEDTLAGSIQFYTGDHVSNKNNIFRGVDQIDPFNGRDFQASISGPILSNKLGYFATVRYNTGNGLNWYDRRFNSADGWIINAYRKWYGQHNPAGVGETGAIYIPDSLRTGDGEMGPLGHGYGISFDGKIAYLPSSSIKLTYHYIGSRSKNKYLYDVSNLPYYQYAPLDEATGWGFKDTHLFNFRHLITLNLFYNLRFSYQHSDWEYYYRKDNKIADYPRDDGIQPISSGSVAGFSFGGTFGPHNNNFKDGKSYQDLYLVNGDINWQIDKHNFIKAGFEIKQHKINRYSWPYFASEDWISYAYTPEIDGADYGWPEYYDLMVDYWKNWDETYGHEKYRYPQADEVNRYLDYTIKPLQTAFYIQDKLEMGEIVVNAGVRLDMFKPNEKTIINKRIESHLLGKESNLKNVKTKYQISPRFGMSFPISEKGAFHVSYGHFFQLPNLENMYNVPLQVLTPLQLSGMNIGNVDLEPERTISYEIGLQQQVSKDYAVDLTLFYKDFRNQLGREQINTVDLIGYYRFVNRDYGNSKGFTLALEKLETGLISGSLDYTYTYTEGSSSSTDLLSVVQVTNRIGAEPITIIDRQIRPLDWDERHVLNGTVIFSKKDNWSVSVVGQMRSGQPYTPVPVRFVIFPQNEFHNLGRKPMHWNVELKAKKYFIRSGMKFYAFFNVDNLFDHLNHQYVFATTGLADENAMVPYEKEIEEARLASEGVFTFEEKYNYYWYFSSPRHIQLGIGVEF